MKELKPNKNNGIKCYKKCMGYCKHSCNHDTYKNIDNSKKCFLSLDDSIILLYEEEIT